MTIKRQCTQSAVCQPLSLQFGKYSKAARKREKKEQESSRMLQLELLAQATGRRLSRREGLVCLIWGIHLALFGWLELDADP